MADLPATLPRDLVPLTFVLGRWKHAAAQEDWVAAGDVLIGIQFDRGRYQVSMIDLADGSVRYVPQPDGGAPIPFVRTDGDNGRAVFVNPFDDHAQQVVYDFDGDRHLSVTVGEARTRYRRVDRAAAPALEDADRAFARAVASGGVDAWVAAFDPAGHQWNAKQGVVTPGPAMRANMADVLAGRLDWAPTASGLAPGGDLGWTVGDWTWIPPDASEVATSKALGGAYVTVWRREADDAWKVWFDTGNPVESTAAPGSG